jgi:dihydroorotate dehydrogenase
MAGPETAGPETAGGRLPGVLDAGYRLARPALFRLDAERAHGLTLGALAGLSRLARVARRPTRPAGGMAGAARLTPAPPVCRVMGIDFPSRVGLAAGMDKDGHALRAWPLLGFGFVEVGTVTAHPQPGNPRPRLFRLPDDGAVINRMGFNNAGAAALAERLARLGPLPVPLGISIGKSKITPVPDAVQDYLVSLRLLHPFADYFAVNVSSPNTPGLRSLQEGAALAELVAALVSASAALAGPVGVAVPIVVKVAPDLPEGAVEEVVEVCLAHGAAGIIATNTTLSRGGLIAGPSNAGPSAAGSAQEAGGLSGRPLSGRALEVVRTVRRLAGDRLAVIGVGGICGPDDARRMLDAGAGLVQLYTGLVYQGPGLVRRVAAAVDHRPAPEPS